LGRMPGRQRRYSIQYSSLRSTCVQCWQQNIYMFLVSNSSSAAETAVHATQFIFYGRLVSA